jgi:hypothetical protein
MSNAVTQGISVSKKEKEKEKQKKEELEDLKIRFLKGSKRGSAYLEALSKKNNFNKDK